MHLSHQLFSGIAAPRASFKSWERAWRQPQSCISCGYVVELLFSVRVTSESCTELSILLHFCFSYLVLLLWTNFQGVGSENFHYEAWTQLSSNSRFFSPLAALELVVRLVDTYQGGPLQVVLMSGLASGRSKAKDSVRICSSLAPQEATPQVRNELDLQGGLWYLHLPVHLTDLQSCQQTTFHQH